MLYRAKYCAECALELQDYGESFWLRSRFCEICKQEFKFVELISRFGGVTIAMIAMIFGIGTILQKPSERPLNVAKTEIANIAPAPKPIQKNENIPPNNNVQPKKVEVDQQVALLSKQPETQPAKLKTVDTTRQNAHEVSQVSGTETVYMCGAKTKKGMPCSRKVKGSVRCWQHSGQDAMLSAKDLRIQ
jgi:hypothetical protein